MGHLSLLNDALTSSLTYSWYYSRAIIYVVLFTNSYADKSTGNSFTDSS